WVVLVVVIIGLTAAVAAGRGGAMARAYPDRREVRLPAGRPMTAADLSKVRFSVVLRGYRMDEVDEVIEHLARELAARDARIAAPSLSSAPAPTRPIPTSQPTARRGPSSPPASHRRPGGRGPAAGPILATGQAGPQGRTDRDGLRSRRRPTLPMGQHRARLRRL